MSDYEVMKTSEEHVSGLPFLSQLMRNFGKEQLWDREDYKCIGSDYGGDRASSPPQAGSQSYGTEERGYHFPVSKCEDRPLTDAGYRNLFTNLGVSSGLVHRAIQELDQTGEGVDYDMLLEDLLSRTAQQDPQASNSQRTSSKKPKRRVKILAEECGYDSKTVKREQDQMADRVDFLVARGTGSNKLGDKFYMDEAPEEHSGWSWLRQLADERVSASNTSERKLGYGGLARRKSSIRLIHRSNLKKVLYGRPTLSHNMPNLKRVESNQPSRNRNLWATEVVSQRRYTPGNRVSRVSRVSRSQVVIEKLSVSRERLEGSVGFGLPGKPLQPRYLDEDVKGAPFFYFENVASMPNDEWDRIRRHLFDIEPEFVDSLHFSACRRPRGYIHNLPTEGRQKILADPPMTIQELLPHTKAFWPAWDPRTKLNCITTRMGSEFLIKKLYIGEGTALQTADPSPEQQREILHLCRHWNLVWSAPNIPTPINEIEIEAMLGFDAGHSRNILSKRSRYKALGNSFSVYTVAFHFSVLKPLFPNGVKVLSLFSGIGGAEVALHKMGVKLQVVVSVEIDDGARRCLEAWWASSNQAGILNQNYRNVYDLGRPQISELVNLYGGFDLIVGGTPCNNLSGSNHVTRVGLDGKQSTIFFEFSRIVAAVRELTIRLHHK